jgi:hypothetical protein
MVNHLFLFLSIFILLVISLKQMLAQLSLFLDSNSISASIMIIIHFYHPFYNIRITFLFDPAIIYSIYSNSYPLILLSLVIPKLFIMVKNSISFLLQ